MAQPGNPDGPSWLGIGAQRSGTTWFTDMFLQHPGVSLGREGRKELHALNSALDGELDEGAYVSQFAGMDTAAGEFTPGYMRMPWVAHLARKLCRPDAPLIAVLRNPIDRFESAMRLYKQRFPPSDRTDKQVMADWARVTGAEVTWGGMYASQLDVWTAWFPPSQFVLIQYETLLAEPQATVERAWEALGLPGVQLQDVDRPSRTAISDTSLWSFQDQPGELRDSLIKLYAPEVDRLAAGWEIERALWPEFAS